MVDRAQVAEEYRAVRSRAGAFDLARDFVRAAGPDATRFLQGQLSQDLGPVGPGSSTWSLLLSPQGKVDAFLRVLRVADDEWMLEVEAGYGQAVIDRLNRFKLRVKCEVETVADWSCIALRGPSVRIVASHARGTMVVADWPGLNGIDIVGPNPASPEGVAHCSAETYALLRVEAGIPEMGAELDERTIPAEAGIVDRSVSFTKGCYTGQELVARIDSRGGNVPRHLRAVVVEGDAEPPVGAEVATDGKVVGRLTTVAWSPALGTAVALGYVGRSVTPPAAVTVTWDGGTAAARVEPLPLTG